MNQVTKAENTALAENDLYGALPTGLENVTAKDQSIPRITILQGLSPQVNKNKLEYIKGAETGDICETGTGSLYKELIFIPCFYARIFLEWAPRESGKGLVMNHGTDDSILKQCTKDEKGRPYTKEGNLVSETMQFMILNMSADERFAFLPLSATNLKHGKSFVTKIMAQKIIRPDGSALQAPLFYRAWRMTIGSVSNNQGDWYAPRFEPSEKTLDLGGKELLDKCVAFHNACRDGLVRTEAPVDEESADDKAM